MTDVIKKVAIFADWLSEPGGVEYYVSQLSTSLKDRGIDVRIYTGTKPENEYWINLLRKKKIRTYYSNLKYQDRKDRTPEKHLVLQIIKNFTFWKPDVIHSCPIGKLVKVWLENENRTKIPVVATEMTTPCASTRHWYSDDLFQKINKFDAIIAWGKVSEKGVKSFLGYQGRTFLIPHFIPEPQSKIDFIDSYDANNQSIGCISRLSPEKGLDYLIASMSFVIKKYPKSTLHIYGEGRDEDGLKYLVKCFGLENSIFFEGTFESVAGIDKVALKHNIFVQPSLFEGMSISMQELMLRKRAIVATKVGGNPELFGNSHAGILVERGDTKALAKKIIFLLGNPSKQLELSKRAYQTFRKRYLNVNVLDLHLRVYNMVIKNHKT